MKYNYMEILTEGCDIELKRLTGKEYNQSCALLTMLLKVLVTCDFDDIASKKTINTNSGIFERKIIVHGDRIERYWIQL